MMVFLLLALGSASSAGISPTGERVEIVLETSTEDTSDDGSSGSSGGHDVVLRTKVEARADGTVYLLDLPPSEVEARDAQWQLPAKILEAPDGKTALLNRHELEQRRDAWLKAAKLEPSMCGRMIFTWNVFKIECDPDSALAIFERFDLGAAIQEGAQYTPKFAARPGSLRLTRRDARGATFETSIPVDPEAIRRDDVQTEIAVAEIMGKTVSLEDATRHHASDSIQGDISVRIETDAEFRPLRRTTKTAIQRTTGGKKSTSMAIDTLEQKAAD